MISKDYALQITQNMKLHFENHNMQQELKWLDDLEEYIKGDEKDD